MSETVNTPAPETPQGEPNKQDPQAQAQGKSATLPKGNITPAKIKIADYEFADENAAKSEIERGRQSGKLLTEAQKRLEQSTRLQKDFEARKKAAKTDFAKALEALEIPHEEAVELMSKYLYEREIAPKQMSPEQKRIRELEQKVKASEEKTKSEEKTRKQQEFDIQVKQEIQKLRTELEGIIKEKKIPGTRIALKRLAMYLKSYEEAGVQVPPARAVDMLMSDYQQEFGELLDEASPEQLESFLGQERMNKLAKNISKWALAKMRGKSAKPDDSVVRDITKVGGDKNKKLSPNDFTKFIGDLT